MAAEENSATRPLSCILFINTPLQNSSEQSRPGGAEQPAEIAPQDQADVCVRVAAPDQLLGQIEDFLRMTETVDVDLVAEHVAGFVRRLQLLVLIGRHVV